MFVKGTRKTKGSTVESTSSAKKARLSKMDLAYYEKNYEYDEKSDEEIEPYRPKTKSTSTTQQKAKPKPSGPKILDIRKMFLNYKIIPLVKTKVQEEEEEKVEEEKGEKETNSAPAQAENQSTETEEESQQSGMTESNMERGSSTTDTNSQETVIEPMQGESPTLEELFAQQRLDNVVSDSKSTSNSSLVHEPRMSKRPHIESSTST